jgi:hypothetical protein
MPRLPDTCEICGREIDVDLAGHYRFHRDAALAFLDLLKREGRPKEWGDLARTRIARCAELLRDLESHAQG